MAAIWGVVMKGKAVPAEVAQGMQKEMQGFKIDRYDEIRKEHVYFACGHQFFTKEAEDDILPYYEAETGIFFTADCVLYNRNELITLLKGREECAAVALECMGDAMLLFWAYKCFGEHFAEKLSGSFSAVIYDTKANQLLLYTDHLSQRYLAYYCENSEICFSTLYQPILSFLGKERIKICREWIAKAYKDCTADTFHIPGGTVYEKVYHVEPGKYVKIDVQTGRTEKITYWNPIKNKTSLKKRGDAAYKELFLSTLQRTVDSLLRANGETGIMLSGGLDSSSVAAMAAISLEKQGKKLYSYTAVPADGFQYKNTNFYIENEKELVLAQKEKYPNIIPTFINEKEYNCFSKMEQYAALYREPVKPALNMLNVEAMASAAAGDGCKILLSGQNGNATISYGNILTYLYQKGISGHWVAAYREAKAFCRLRRVARKKLLEVFLKTLKEEHFGYEKPGKDCLLKEADMKKYQICRLERQIQRERGNGSMDSKKQRKGFCFMPLVFQHMGFYGTYSSLQYGVLSLDPTLTKEIIELCMQLPIDCYVHAGKERRMVRDYMAGYVPDRILNNHTGRGIQAADFAYRVNRDWDRIKGQVYDILCDEGLAEYLDAEKLQALVREAMENEYNMDKNLVSRLAVIASLGYFVCLTKKERAT